PTLHRKVDRDPDILSILGRAGADDTFLFPIGSRDHDSDARFSTEGFLLIFLQTSSAHHISFLVPLILPFLHLLRGERVDKAGDVGGQTSLGVVALSFVSYRDALNFQGLVDRVPFFYRQGA